MKAVREDSQPEHERMINIIYYARFKHVKSFTKVKNLKCDLSQKPRCDRKYGMRTVFCRTLTSFRVSYLQPKFTNGSTECAIDSRKRKQ